MPDGVSRGLLALEVRLAKLAQRKWLAVTLTGLIALAGRALLLPILPVPKPAIQDEFSYLLQADTFAHGRLANPTPRFAEHFETLQVLVHPTYASKYPPLSGLVMAAGEKLAGEPWLGVWLSMGILCAVLCWALEGWLPAGWAFAGSLIAALHIGIVSYWTESYWGGTCAAIGGALVIGAAPRLIERLRAPSAMAFAAGLALLANTRPYEGLLLAVVCSTWVAWAALRRHGAARIWKHAVLPMALILIPVFAWMGYYNYRVTGNGFEMPYVAHERQYSVWSPFLWVSQPRPAPEYDAPLLRAFWVGAEGGEKQYAHEHALKAHWSDLLTILRFYLGWPLVLCIAMFGRQLWRDAAARRALLLAAVFYVGAALETRLVPHYVAPAAALAYILAACAVRAARDSWSGSLQERVFVSWSIVALFAVTTGLALLSEGNRYLYGPVDYHARAEHATVMAQLAQEPGRQLVLVRYGPHHDLWQELVYNRADIDGSKVIWARSLGPEKDAELVRYYAGRNVWLLEEDGSLQLSRYSSSQEASAGRYSSPGAPTMAK